MGANDWNGETLTRSVWVGYVWECGEGIERIAWTNNQKNDTRKTHKTWMFKHSWGLL
jgi:hypothetical protein